MTDDVVTYEAQLDVLIASTSVLTGYTLGAGKSYVFYTGTFDVSLPNSSSTVDLPAWEIVNPVTAEAGSLLGQVNQTPGGLLLKNIDDDARSTINSIKNING